ncbi:MAG TPA: hypothetical protein DCP92_09210 [Nitrospiraceae bacterium]|nr:hypothetical protein [Nitrospiraceae bacterium]
MTALGIGNMKKSKQLQKSLNFLPEQGHDFAWDISCLRQYNFKSGLPFESQTYGILEKLHVSSRTD